MKGKLVLYPNSILRRKCRVVKDNKGESLKVIEDLKKVLLETDISAGLAAPQLGYDLRIFGVKHHGRDKGENYGDLRVFINPKIILGKGEKEYLLMEAEGGEREDFLEGCLSFPELFGTVKRWREIEVEYGVFGSKGDVLKRKEKLTDFEAIVFQHELDHLDGVLFVDHVKKQNGKFYKQEKGKMVDMGVDEILKD